MPGPLIGVAELGESLASATPPLLIDARPAEEFARGQIPGAVHLDLWGVSLIDTSDAPRRAFMWMIGHLFSQRGVTAERPVVVYEQNSGIRAARVFWLLEYLGHRNVRVLDGGLRAWAHDGHPLIADPVVPTVSSWHGEAQPEKIATWQDVLSCLGDPGVVILDTRSEGEYWGTNVRAARGGRIPGAVHLEWKDNLDSSGRFKSEDALREMYHSRGVTSNRDVVTYCQGGYRAAHAYLALRQLGFPRVRNYTGSWKEWGDRADLPIETA